jgi:Trk K+ transport system NAD-binding subunit
VIVYGLGRYGGNLARRLAAAGWHVLAVDWDPRKGSDQHDDATEERLSVVYGDAEDPDFPGVLPLERARWVVSTVPRYDTSQLLPQAMRRWGFTGGIAVTAHRQEEADRLAGCGADLVLQPFGDAADRGVDRLIEALDEHDPQP